MRAIYEMKTKGYLRAITCMKPRQDLRAKGGMKTMGHMRAIQRMKPTLLLRVRADSLRFLLFKL